MAETKETKKTKDMKDKLEVYQSALTMLKDLIRANQSTLDQSNYLKAMRIINETISYKA